MVDQTMKKVYKQTEVGTIPEDWEVFYLRDLLSFKNGLNKEKKFFGQGTPIVNYMDVFKNSGIYKTDLEGKVTLSNEEIKNYSAKLGDVFFTRTSETPLEIGIASVLLENVEDCVFSGFILRGRPKNNLLNINFSKYCFKANYIRKQIISSSSYTTRALTNGRHLSEVILIKPPTREEQHAIAQVLTDTDQLLQNLKKLIAKKKAIKQGSMQELLTGKKRLPGFEGEWEIRQLGSLLQFGSGKDYKHLDSGNIPVYGTGGIMTFVNDCLFDGESVGIGRKGTIDKPVFLTGKFWTVDTLFFTHSFRDSIPKYIYYQFLLIKWKEYNEASGVPSLNKNTLEKIEINIPTLIEQKAIAQILSDMDLEIEALEKQLYKTEQLKQGLMQELLTGKTRLVAMAREGIKKEEESLSIAAEPGVKYN